MAINFDSLPKHSPNALPEKGRYRAKITSAQIREGSNGEYLQVQIMLFDKENNKIGSYFDNFTESENETQQYKIRRLIESLRLQISGMFTLKDLSKIIPNRFMQVDITHEPAKNGYPARAITDVFSGEIYYTDDTTDSATATKPKEVPVESESDLPFKVNAADATDAKDPVEY